MHTTPLVAVFAAMSTLVSAKPMPQASRERFIALRNQKRANFPAGFGPAPLKLANTTTEDGGPAKTSSSDDAADTEYSSNWSGSILNAASGSGFSSAVGTVAVQSCSDPNDGSSGPWYNTAWVGIDGAGPDTSGLLQAGVICEIDTDGTESYYPWVEYFPSGLITIDDFTVNQGDSLTVTVDVLSTTSGSLALVDNSNGQSFTTTLSAPAATDTLIGGTAEWILEDFSSGGGLVPFAAFSPVVWTASSATYSDGSVADATSDGWNPTILQNSAGDPITAVQADASDSLTITYTG